MVPISRINKAAPLLALCAVVLSVMFPGSQKREVERVRQRCEALAADNDTLRNDLLGVLAFLRSYEVDLPGSNAVDVVGSPDDTHREVLGGRYMRARGRDGFAVGRDWWLAGDRSPWGVVAEAFPGGFLADGRFYRFVNEYSPKE